MAKRKAQAPAFADDMSRLFDTAFCQPANDDFTPPVFARTTSQVVPLDLFGGLSSVSVSASGTNMPVVTAVQPLAGLYDVVAAPTPVPAPAAPTPASVSLWDRSLLDKMRDISNDAYHADTSAVNRSKLATILRSPAHLKTELGTPHRETPDMLLGQALHLGVLEPHLFASRVVSFSGRRSGPAWHQFQAQHAGKIILTEQMFACCQGMVKALRDYQSFPFEDKPFGEFITGAMMEKTLFWQDPDTGLKMKARLDILLPTIIFDIKKCVDARPEHFMRTAIKLDYDLQAFMYTEACREALGLDLPFVFAAVEGDAPHGVWFHEADEDFMDSGRAKYRRAVDLYSQCIATGQWPSYQDAWSKTVVPRWAKAVG